MSYYPILKHSNAEICALENLKDETKELIIPVIESKMISPKNQKEWWPTFNTLGTYLRNKLGQTKFIYDFNTAFEKIGEISEEIKPDDNQNLVDYCVNKLKESELNFIPCVHFDSPNWIINSVLSSETDEIAIRIRCHDFQTPMEISVISRVEDDIIGKDPHKKYTIILDFYNSSINEQRINTSLKNFSQLNYDNIVLILTNCPETANDAPPNTFKPFVVRNDLKTFNKFKRIYPDLQYGDYTVRLNPELDNKNINYYNTYLKIFYTSEDYYNIGKSTLIGENGIQTFISICKEIVDSDIYKSEDFSHGDKAIKDCADGVLEINNHSKPIEYGINHHIELTARQL